MKKRISVFILVITLLCNMLPVDMLPGNVLTVQAETTNLITNGGFEEDASADFRVTSGSSNSDAIIGWSCSAYNDGSVVDYKLVSGGHNSSDLALQFAKNAGTSNTNGRARGNVTQMVTGLTIGKVYKLTAYVKAEEQNDDAEIKVLAYESNTEIGRSGYNAKNIGADWKELNIEWVAASETVKVDFSVTKSTQGSFLIDNVSLVESDSAVPTLTLSPSSISALEVGSTQVITPTLTDNAAVMKGTIGYTWVSDDEHIATVDENGIVTAVSAGTTTINITVAGVSNGQIKGGRISSTCSVTVVEKPVIGVFINGDFETEKDGSCQVANGVTDSTSIKGWNCWAASGSTLDFQIVENEGRNDSHAMKISKASGVATDTAVRGSFTQAVSELTIGKIYKFSAYVKMVNQTNANAEAKVLIKTPKSSGKGWDDFGTSNIVMKSAAGTDWNLMTFEWVAEYEKYNFEIAIKNSKDGYFLLDDVSIEESEKTVPTLAILDISSLEAGSTQAITKSLKDDDSVFTGDISYTWKSTNTAVATVDENGVVTGVTAGSTTIICTAIAKNGSISSTCSVTVVEKPIIGAFVNGDFETEKNGSCQVANGVTDSTSIKGWNCWAASGSTLDFQIVENEGRNDSHAMKISKASSVAADTSVRGSFTQAVTGLDVGAKYKVSAYVKMVNQTNTNAEAKVLIKKPKSSGSGWDDFETSNIIRQSAAGTDWNLMTFEWVAEYEKYNFEIAVKNSKDGYFLLDDVTIERIGKNEPILTINPVIATVEVTKDINLTTSLIDPDKVLTGTINYSWTSSDSSVATVDAYGLVTGIKAGQATITVTASDGTTSVSKECTIIVSAESVIYNHLFNGDFEYDTDAAYLNHDINLGTKAIADSYWNCWTANGYVINYEVVQEGRNDSYAMKISRGDAAIVDSKIRGTIHQKVSDLTVGDTYKFTIWVNFVDQSNVEGYAKVKFTHGTGSAKKESYPSALSATQLSSKGNWVELTYEWVAEDEVYTFEIDCGKADDGYFLLDDVSVVRVPTEPEMVVTPVSLELEIGSEEIIQAQVQDPDHVLTGEVEIKWSSDNTSVATVNNNGKVTAVAVGEASIMAVAEDGSFGAACIVTVVEQKISLTGIALKETTEEMYVGSQKTLEVEFTPKDATDKTLLWSSSDETVVSVDANGMVTAWKAGTATITAKTTLNSSVTSSCEIEVKESTSLTTTKASFTTEFGVNINGSLTSNVLKPTDSMASYQLLIAPEKGILELAADGTFTYIPKGYGEQEYVDSFIVGVTVGTESAILSGEITVNKFADSIASKLTATTTMMITREELAQIRLDMQDENSVRYQIWIEYEPYLQQLLQIAPPEDENPRCSENCANDSIYESEWQKPIADRTAQLLWAYLLTEDEAYKEQCIKYAMACVQYKHWGSKTQYYEADLSAGQMAFAIGLVYNWLNDDLTYVQKTAIADKLYYTCGQLYYNVKGKPTDTQLYQNNHFWVRTGGLNSAAMALYIHADEVSELLNKPVSDIKANCIGWLEVVYEILGYSFDWSMTDGANHEGVSYYIYGLEHLLKNTLLLRNNLGIDMITGNTWFENTSDFFVNVAWPKNNISKNSSIFEYADGNSKCRRGPSHVFRALAGLYHDETAQWLAETWENADANSDQYDYWLGLLWADSSVEAKLSADISNLYYADDMQMVTARSDWSGDESIVIMRSGLPLGKTGVGLLPLGASEYHVDPDCNAIVLFYNGEYLLRTDGYADFKMTKNFSTLLINGYGQIGGNEAKAGMIGDPYFEYGLEPEIKKTETGEGYSYFVGDATEAYLPEYDLTKFERNVVLLEEEKVLLVVDNIKTAQSKDLELRWFPSAKSVTESYGIYSVISNDNITKFYPFTEETETAWTDVDVYITGANEEEKAFVQNYSGLAWQNAVAFSWSKSGENQTNVRYVEGNDNEHKFEVNGKIYTINVAQNTVSVDEGTLDIGNEPWDSDSTLANVLMNGLSYEDFNSAVTDYSVERFWKTEKLNILPLPNSPSATTEVIWDGACPGIAKIVCTSGDGEHITTYTFNLKNDKGMLSIMSASSEPNASGISLDYTYDNYIQEIGSDKTWSSKLLPVVTYDMGILCDITKIDVAFNYSRDRSTFFDLLVSEDGVTWQTILVENPDTGGCEQTPQDQGRSNYTNIYDGTSVLGRYVRLNLRSHTESGYDNPDAFNSIQEISIYGTVVSTEGDGNETGAGSGEGTNDETGAGSGEGTGESGNGSSIDNGGEVGWESDSEADNSEDVKHEKTSHMDADAPKTGDKRKLCLWFACMLFAICTMNYWFIKLKK